jgi:outer membrane protein TolC
MNKSSLLISVLLLTFFFKVQAQEVDTLKPAVVLSLEDVIELAKQQSPSYYQAANSKELRYWQWRNYKSDYLPQLFLFGTLPNYEKAYNAIPQPDGSYDVRLQHYANSNLALSLQQNVGATGGRFFATSRLNRIDNFNNGRTINYNSRPFLLGYQQPLFQFNELQWARRIEPLRFEESKRQYLEDLEEIALTATDRFFTLLLEQMNLEIALKNQANNDTIYKIAQGRYNLGKIAEDELLQLELTSMNSDQAVSQARLNLETSTLQLKIYIGLTDNQPIQLVRPDSIPTFEVDENKAITEANKNRWAVIAFKRRLLEAERDVAKARGDNGLNVDINATYGTTGVSRAQVGDSYANTVPQQTLQVQFNIPIMDWGRSRSRRKVAMANYDVEKNIVAQDVLNFEQQIYTQVRNYRMLKDQLKITRKSDEVAQKRYDISKNRYLIGKIDITNLNIALQEKDKAKRDYIASLKSFWVAHYNLRQLTLYDFETNQPIVADENSN